MTYYLAPSLSKLRDEINDRWSGRDKASDGWIGDPSHATGESDHNPDYDSGGVVRAIDIDKDGIDMLDLLAVLIGDPRVAYVIWNKQISSATRDGNPWNWEPYSGTNTHEKHVHISIKHTDKAEESTNAWFTKEDDMQLNDDIYPGGKKEMKVGGLFRRLDRFIERQDTRAGQIRGQVARVKTAVESLPEGATKSEIRTMLNNLDAEINIFVGSEDEPA